MSRAAAHADPVPSTPLPVPKPSVAHQDERPLVVAIAAVFGALLAAEVLFLGECPSCRMAP